MTHPTERKAAQFWLGMLQDIEYRNDFTLMVDKVPEYLRESVTLLGPSLLRQNQLTWLQDWSEEMMSRKKDELRRNEAKQDGTLFDFKRQSHGNEAKQEEEKTEEEGHDNDKEEGVAKEEKPVPCEVCKMLLTGRTSLSSTSWASSTGRS